MSELVWSIKLSLLRYVAGLSDGDAQFDGVTVQEDGFHFPADPSVPDRYTGRISLSGHGGRLHFEIRDPGIDDGGRLLTIAHDESRLVFAKIHGWQQDGSARRAHGTALTGEGAGLFFGPYQEGTSIDDPLVL